jgi:hypothetical protein
VTGDQIDRFSANDDTGTQRRPAHHRDPFFRVVDLDRVQPGRKLGDLLDVGQLQPR